jgi:glycosyltransferase involved in cell wall biosynthesis
MIDQPLRLLWFNLVTDADAPIQGFATNWINALAPHCQYLDVITMQAGRIDVADNVRVFSLGKERGHSEPYRAVVFYRLLFNLLRERHYDACFAHMQPLFTVMGGPLLKLYKVPVTMWYTHKSVTPKLQQAERMAHRVVTASPESFRIVSDKVRIVGHGIDTQFFTPAAERQNGKFTILSVSRISPVKRLETIIEAAHRLAQDDHDFCLRIVGNVYPHDEAYARQLHHMVENLNLEDKVEFAGEVPHHAIAQEYQSANVMINMSNTGSVDKAVLEAMACGMPVITANEAFEPILARWGQHLLTPMDAPDVLAERIQRVAAMTVQERTKLGQDLRELVLREHSLDRLTEILLSIFRTGELPV